MATYSIAARTASLAESNSGTTNFTFRISRVGSGSQTSIAYSVAGAGTDPASASDFVGGAFPSGVVTLLGGTNNFVDITVGVAGDIAVEPDEQFAVSIVAADGGTIQGGPAIATILNDDAVAFPATPSYTSRTANLLTQTAFTTALAGVQNGPATLLTPNPDGSVPSPQASAGILVVPTGGSQFQVPTSYGDVFLTGSTPTTLFAGGRAVGGSFPNQTIVTGTAGGITVLNGGNTTVVGGGNNQVFALGGAVNVALDTGDDTAVIYGGAATVDMGGGHNLLGFTSNPNTGGQPAATVTSTGDDTILAASGLTFVNASTAGATGSELIGVIGGTLGFLGGAANATVIGSTGHMTIVGGTGNLLAGATADGSNLLVGGAGSNILFGKASGDILVAGTGASILVAGAGNETLTAAGSAIAQINAFSALPNSAPASGAANVFYGGSGTDVIVGGNGSDTVVAGTGNSTITLGAGADLLYVPGGNPTSRSITVTDFNGAAGDRISLLGVGGYTASAVSGGTRLSLSDGTQITLNGLASFNPSQVLA